jgi:hypothetical protein
MNANKNWQAKNGGTFLVELIIRLGDEATLPLVVAAINNLLIRTKDRTELVRKVSNRELIGSLFSVIANNKTTGLHLNSIGILCREKIFFEQLQQMTFLHFFIPCLRLSWDNLTTIQMSDQVNRLEETLDILKLFSSQKKFVTEMNTNGILMYLVMITFGMYPIEEKLRVKSSILIGDFLGTTQEDESTFFILSKVIPLPIIEMLQGKTQSMTGFIESFTESPECIWKDSMLKELKLFLDREFKKASNGPWIPSQTLQYEELKKELYLTIFIRIYNEDRKYANWVIKNGPKFLSSCVKHLIEKKDNGKTTYAVVFALVKCLGTQPDLSGSPAFLDCANTLFSLLSDKTPMEIVVKTCQLLHILFISNQEFVKKVVLEKLWEVLVKDLNPNNMEIFLSVLLCLIQNSTAPLTLDCDRLVKLWKEWSNQAIRMKLEFVLKSSEAKDLPMEIRVEIDQLVIPPKDAPLASTFDLTYAVQFSLK